MSVNRIGIVIAGLAGAALLSGCGSEAAGPSTDATSTAAGGQAPSPACPGPPMLSAPPARVVTMDGNAAAVLVRLGVGDRIVGTAAPEFIAEYTGAERQALDAIPVLDPGTGNAEKVIEARPDLVVGVSNFSFGGFDGTPTVERLAQAGAKALASCPPAGSGPVTDLGQTTAFISEAAAAFGVKERGDRIVAQFQAQIAANRVPAGGTPVRVLTVSAAPTPGQPVMTRGGRSLANAVISLAGGENVAQDTDTDLASLSAEEVVTRDPQALVVISGFSPLSDDDLLAAIRSSPVLAPTTAVRENRLVVVPLATLVSPSLLNADAVARIAAALRGPAG